MKNVKNFDQFLNEAAGQGYPNGIGVNSPLWKSLKTSLNQLNPKPEVWKDPEEGEENINFNPTAAGPDFGISFSSSKYTVQKVDKVGSSQGLVMPFFILTFPNNLKSKIKSIIEESPSSFLEIKEFSNRGFNVLYDPTLPEIVANGIRKVLNAATGKA